jgi:hypothetical protein
MAHTQNAGDVTSAFPNYDLDKGVQTCWTCRQCTTSVMHRPGGEGPKSNGLCACAERCTAFLSNFFLEDNSSLPYMEMLVRS